jgi:hypothetical protein
MSAPCCCAQAATLAHRRPLQLAPLHALALVQLTRDRVAPGLGLRLLAWT